MEIELAKLATDLNIIKALQLVVIVLVIANVSLVYAIVRQQRTYNTAQDSSGETIQSLADLLGTFNTALINAIEHIKQVETKVETSIKLTKDIQKKMESKS